MTNGTSASSSNDADPIEEDECDPIEMFPSNVSDSGAAASSSTDTDQPAASPEEEDDHEEAASDTMVLGKMPRASPTLARSPEPSESSESIFSNDADRIVIKTALEEEDDHDDAPMTNGTSASSSNDADPIEEDECDPIEMFPSNVSDSGAASDPTPFATSLPRSPPKDGRRPNPSTAHLPACRSPARRSKRRKPTLTFQKKQDSCREELGVQIIEHLEKGRKQ
jgi:hypothetical protein